MKATFLDLRRHMREVLKALDRNEPVTVLYRGEEKAVLYPVLDRGPEQHAPPMREHPAVGMWADRKDLEDVPAVVRRMRRGRGYAL